MKSPRENLPAFDVPWEQTCAAAKAADRGTELDMGEEEIPVGPNRRGICVSEQAECARFSDSLNLVDGNEFGENVTDVEIHGTS